MENPEEVLQSLDEFAKLKPKDIPRELEDYLSYVAKTGDPVYQWSIVKCLFREKLLNVITDFYETSPTIDLPPCPNVDPFNYETMKNSLLERLDSFPSAPFTVQRLCELLTTPRKEYSRADKFMRAVEKNILVVSTREPGNVRRTDNNGQSELLMNGVMDGRGIELGEAIETVSSEGVNMMHANESEVNVTENENVVPVECAGMEEIDMEEQGEGGDNMEATNSNTWDKEQSDTAGQNEESGDSKTYEKDEESKTKEESNIVETSTTENVETNSAELPGDAENVGSTEVIPEIPNVESDSSSLENKPDVEVTTGGAEAEADTEVEAEAESESEVTVEANASTSEASEEISEEKPSEHTSVTEEKDAVDSSSTNEEDLSKHVSSTDETTADGNTNDDTVAENSQPEASSSVVPNTSETVAEVVTSSVEDVIETDSSTTDIPSVETCEKSEESGVSVDSATSETVVLQEISSSEEVPVATSEAEKVEETVCIKPLPCDEAETNSVDEPKQDLEQDEAMEVDENVPNAETDEPMDQSEQPAKVES